MLRKRIALFVLTVAYAILLGHNIVPHHHHDTDNNLTEHHHNDHHDNDKKDSNDSNQFYSHFIHANDGLTATNNHNLTNTFSKRWISIVATLSNNFSFGNHTIPPLLDKPPSKQLIYISPHSLSSGLRAPPSVIA